MTIDALATLLALIERASALPQSGGGLRSNWALMSGRPGAVDLSVVALASAGVRLASSANVDAVPEPSTWAMLALGFLGLGGLGLSKRKRADEIGLR